MSRRTERVGELFREELSDILLREVHDPRLSPLISFTRVWVSPDLSLARVYFSVLGSDEDRKQTLAALTAASGYLRRLLSQRVKNIRRMPDLSFHIDESMEQAAHIMDLLTDISHEHPQES